MSKPQPCSIANKILKFVTLDNSKSDFSPYLKTEFKIDSENIKEYHKSLLTLKSCIPELGETMTMKVFQSRVLQFIVKFKKTQTNIKHSDFDAFKNNLKNEEVKEYNIFADVVGLDMWGEDQPICLGPYTIFDYEKHKDKLHEMVAVEMESFSTSSPLPKSLLHVKISARDVVSAQELAEEKFSRFRKVVSFMLNNRKYGSGVHISARQHADIRRLYVSTPGNLTISTARTDGMTVTITDGYFSAAEFGHSYIWEMLSSNNLTEIQTRVITAIDWLGEAMLDESPSSTLLKAAIALEALLGLDRNNITKNLSENVAQILCNNVQSRIYIEDKIRTLYGARSSVVHGRSSNNNEADAQEFLDYCAECVAIFLTVEKLKEIKTEEELKDFFAFMKYSGPTLQ